MSVCVSVESEMPPPVANQTTRRERPAQSPRGRAAWQQELAEAFRDPTKLCQALGLDYAVAA